MDLKRFAVYSYCFSDNCCQATAGGNGSDPHLNMIVTIIPSTTRSISERIPTSNKTCLLIPYLKHRGDLVWCMLSVLTLCKRTVTRIGCAGYARLVVTHRQTVHQRNFAGSRTLSSFNSIIHYYTLHY